MMKDIWRDRYHADIPVMTAFREQVAHLLRIYVVQQILVDHEVRSDVLRVAEILGDALVETFLSTCREEGTAALSLLLQIMPPSKWRSVQRVLKFCRKRMQKYDLPDTLGPPIMQVNRTLNLRSSVIREVGVHSC